MQTTNVIKMLEALRSETEGVCYESISKAIREIKASSIAGAEPMTEEERLSDWPTAIKAYKKRVDTSLSIREIKYLWELSVSS